MTAGSNDRRATARRFVSRDLDDVIESVTSAAILLGEAGLGRDDARRLKDAIEAVNTAAVRARRVADELLGDHRRTTT